MKIIVIIKGNDREGFGCWTEDVLPYCNPVGQGDTIDDCKKNFIQCLNDIQRWSREDSIEVPVVTEIEWRVAS